MKKLLIGLVLTSLSLASVSVKAESLDNIGDDLFEKKVLEIIMKNPEVIEKSMKLYVEKKRKEQENKQLADSLKNRYQVNFGASPTLGKKDAKYQLVVFTDFQCPYCKKGNETIQTLKEEYGDDLLIIHKNYPLAFHDQAKPAAKAALAAHQQNKFFEYSELLFKNQNKLSNDLYIELAKDLKLDIGKFKKDMGSDEVQKLLDQDKKDATEVKVSSTPNFILNGVKIAGAYPLEYFEKIIESLDTNNK